MANIYVRSSDGSDGDNGSTWALAKATITGAAAIDSAGDDIFLSSSHAESTASAVTVNLAGTPSSPVRIISANDSAEPPTTATAGASITTTGSNSLTIRGSAYFYGITFSGASGAVNAGIVLNDIGSANARQIYESCVFRAPGTGSSAWLGVNSTISSNSDPNWTKWINCTARFGRAAGGILSLCGHFIWEGGGIESGGTALTTALFAAPNSGRPLIVSMMGLDLSELGAACSLFTASAAALQVCTVANCKLPASWSGGLVTGTKKAQGRYSMYNCDNADTNYRLWIEDYAGVILDETTIVKTGGASDGTTPIAWRMTTDSNANEAASPLVSDPIAVWVDDVGSSKTIELDFIHDSATALQNDEVWIEVEYLGTSGFPLGAKATDHRATQLAFPADHASSSATWTTTGLTNPNEQKFSVSFTPQEKGVAHIRVYVGKPSQTIYVDPKPTVT